jgi:hypothetical protein
MRRQRGTPLLRHILQSHDSIAPCSCHAQRIGLPKAFCAGAQERASLEPRAPPATPGPRRLRRAQHPRRGTPAPGGSAALHGLDRCRRLESGSAARGNTGRRTWERGSATTFRVINGTDGQSYKCTVTATFSDGDILQADTLLRFATSRVMTDRTALTLILLCAALAMVVGYWP